MVGIITGSGLGLDSSSLQALGTKGQLGDASSDKTGESVYVNAANGNLIIRDRDEMLLGQGVGAQIFRSYNSQSTSAAGWQSGATPTIAGLTGTLNTAGSTVTRTDWDGSTIVYGWDTAAAAYVSSAPGGARQTITGNGSSWSFRDDTSGTIESYDATAGGRLVSRKDIDGNTTAFAYNAAGLLSQVTTGSAETVTLTYDASNRLVSIAMTARNAAGNVATSTRVYYGYDAQGRLSTVGVDLTPDDNSVADGNVYTTTYTYDGTSTRVASILHPDGTSINFTYVLSGTAYKVAGVTEKTASGVANTTAFRYSGTTLTAVVTSAGATSLVYDASGRLTSVTLPSVGGQTPNEKYAYDTSGRLVRSTDTLGRVTVYTYNAQGDLLRSIDTLGNVVDRTYGSHNELLTEWRYYTPVTVDGTGAPVIGPKAKTTQAFARYVYDGEQHLRFATTTEGRVTEFRYDAAGNRTSQIIYTGALYTTDPSTADTALTEAQMDNWLTTVDKSASQRIDTTYDFRGQISSTTSYAVTRVDGAGDTDSTHSSTLVTRYVYDAEGRLIQRFTGANGSVKVVDNVYDGMGRLLSSTAADGSITTWHYNESTRTTVQTLANGLVRTATYDAADRLVSSVDSGTTGVIARTTYTYDVLGRLTSVTDAAGRVTYMVYDALGRKATEIGPGGEVTDFRYDVAGRQTGTVTYATTVSGTTLTGIVTGGTTRPATTTADRRTWTFYDTNSRVVKTVDAEGDVVDYGYDAAGHLVASTARAVRADVATLTATPTLANATVAANTADRVSRVFYDKDGLAIGQLDAEGYLTTIRYNAAGQRVETVRYATAVPSASRTNPDLSAILPAVTSSDIHQYSLYDDSGRLRSEIDGEGYVTNYTYDTYGNVASRLRGMRVAPAAITGGQSTTIAFTAKHTYGTDDTVKVYVDGVVVGTFTVPYDIVSTSFSLKVPLSPLVDHVISLDPSDTDVVLGAPTWNGGVIATVANRSIGAYAGGSALASAWTVDASSGLALLSPTSTDRTTYTYDAQGRLTASSTVDATSSAATDSRSYDNQGRLIRDVSTGRTVEYRYDLQGNLVAQLGGEGSVALAGLGASPTAAQVEGIWSSWATHYTYDAAGQMTSATDPNGQRTVYYYDADGRLKVQVNALGEAIGRDYDTFGNLVKTTTFGQRLAAADVAELTGGVFTVAVQTKLDALDASTSSVTTMSYTTTGRLAEVDSPLGHFVRYTYDAFGDVTSTTRDIDATHTTRTDATFDHLGNALTTTADAGGLNLLSRSVRDAFGRVIEAVDANGLHRFWTYDRSGNVISVTDGVGKTSRSTYDALGRVLTHTDANGGVTKYAYLAEQGVQVTTPEGIVTTQVRDAFGQTISVKDGEGRSTTYTYDADGHLKTTTDASGTIKATYDKAGQQISTSDRGGFVINYGYDAAGRVLTRTVDPTGLNLSTTYTYDAKGQQISTTDPAGRTVVTSYDNAGQTTSIVADPSGLKLTTRFTYDASGHVLRKTDGDATGTLTTTQYTYDNDGRLVSTIVDPDGLKLTTTYSYDANGNVIAVRDAAGNTAQTVYDGENRAIYAIDPLGAVTFMEYDAAGNLTRRTAYASLIGAHAFDTQVPTAASVGALVSVSSRDEVTRYAYDKDNRLRFTQRPTGVVTEQTYDRTGSVVLSRTYTVALALTGAFTVSGMQTGLAGKAHRTTHYLYDAAGRLTFTVDAAGVVTQTAYDAAGLAWSSTVFTALFTGAETATLTDLQSWASAHTAAADQTTRNFHDAAGRTVYTIDAEGYATGYTYDGAGNVTAQRRYDAKPALGTSPTTASVAAALAGKPAALTQVRYDTAGRVIERVDADGVVTHYTLDTLGRTLSSTLAYGTAAAATTSWTYDVNGNPTSETRQLGDRTLTTAYVYDALGRRTQVIDPRGVEVSDRTNNTAAVLALRKTLGVVDTAGNGKSGDTLTDADVARLRSYYTVTSDYDADGRVVATHSPYGDLSSAVPTMATVTTSYDAFGNAVQVTDARSGVGYFYFDGSNQVIGQIDPAGYYTQTDRDAFGNAVAVRAYTGKVATIDPSTRPTGTGNVALTQITYDALNRVTVTTDAEGGIERYGYDAFGNRTSVTNKLGGVTTYTFDHSGHVLSETLPIKASNGTTAVVNTYTYDARGNRATATLAAGSPEVRTESYTYDLADRLLSTNRGSAAIYDAQGARTASIVESRTYDARGNLISTTDAAGKVTAYYYDLANRQIAQLAPTGAYTRYEYDAAGNRTRSLAYANPISPLPAPGGTTPLPVGPVRDTQFSYDAANRIVRQYQPDVITAQAVGGAASTANFSTATGIEQTWTYDASGQLTVKKDGAGHITRTWYDTLGQAVLTIDAEGYGTRWTRDQDGNVLSETRYATKYAGDPAALTDPTSASWTTSSDDRVTLFTYDKNGRVLTQTTRGVAYGTLDSNGRLTQATADATTSYAYDAAGNLLRRTQANGSIFSYTFDLAGRSLSESSPTFTDYNGVAVQVTTSYTYDAFNNVASETHRGSGTGNDEVSTYRYDTLGHLVSKTNAVNVTTTMDYDAVGNLTRMSNPLTDASGAKNTQTIVITYDKGNHETARTTSVGATSGVVRNTQYNAFGEITGRGIGGILQEVTEYDLAGRVLRTNVQNRPKIYLYDGNGNATLAIESQTTDLMAVSLFDAMGKTNDAAIFATADLDWTLTVYDGKDEVVDVIQPTMVKDTGHLGLEAHHVAGTAPGNIGVDVGGPVGPAQHLPGVDGANLIVAMPGGVVGNATSSTHWEHAANWTSMPSSILLDVDVPDMSSVFGAYTLRIVAGSKTIVATSPPYSFHNVSMPIPAVGAWGPYGGDAAYTLQIFVTPRNTGVEQLVGQATSSTGHVTLSSTPQQGYIVSGGPGSITLPINLGSPKLKLSAQDSSQIAAGSLRAQVYARVWGPNGPYAAFPVTVGNPTTIDLSGLQFGQAYELLYVAERPDGTVVRTEQYQVVPSNSPSVGAVFQSSLPAAQMIGAGTFIVTNNALVGIDMRLANGSRAAYASFAYRPHGSTGGFTWAAGSAQLATGSSSISLAGIPAGDYDLEFWMFDANGNGVQRMVGRLNNGGTPSISLEYPRPADNNITLTNLPTTASTANIVFVNPANGQTFQSGALSVTTPGSLAWAIPQSMLDASGALTNWNMTVTLSDSRVQPATTYNVTGTVGVGYGRAIVTQAASVQGNLFTLSFVPTDSNNQEIAAGQYITLRYWDAKADIVNHPELIQRRIIQKTGGVYQWDSLGLDKSTTYAYYYDVFATLAQAQSPATSPILAHANGQFVPANTAVNQEAHWVVQGINDPQTTVHRKQSWNAFGQVASETDGRGNTTALEYNTLGNLVTKKEAAVSVTYANGYQARVTPTTHYVYDLLGRQVGIQDANSHWTTQSWNDGLNKVAAEYRADGGVTTYSYDAQGNQRTRIVALDVGSLASGRRTDYTYDGLNRLVRVDGPEVAPGQRTYDIYVYDEQDRRISHTNVLGTDTVSYDVEGNVSAVKSAAGRVTSYTADWDASIDNGRGGWIKTTTLPYTQADADAGDVHTLTDTVNSFGQILDHLDAGWNYTTYDYYKNGLVKQQGNTVFTYYNNGLLKTSTNNVTGVRETFEYDANGNVTFDGLTGQGGKWAFQQSVSTYDELNRLVKVVDPRYTIDYEYDAVGNRIHMKSDYSDGLGQAHQIQDYWYEYDNMNRFTVTMGQLLNGTRGANATDTTAHVTVGAAKGDGVAIGYNAFGERKTATYASDGHTEAYSYDAGGFLTVSSIVVDGVTTTATRTNDLAGRVTHYVEIKAGTATPLQDVTHVYDADSLITKDIDNVASATVGNEVGTLTTRLADGTVASTATYGQRTVVTTTYNYVWFDSAKQREIKVKGTDDLTPKWKSGLSLFNYDSEGNLTSAVDMVGGRAFQYETDAQGRILQRDELLNVAINGMGNFISGATSNRFHSYYYMDGNQIGNIGNDGPERLDYARELAEHAAQSANKDDSHKIFKPVAFADFDANYQPINSTYPGTASTSYIVHANDTLPSIAQAIWGDSSLWWMLADANNLTLDSQLVPNSVLTVPNKVTNIHNNSTTVRPYDPGKAIGNTQPTLPEQPPLPPPPKPPGGGCGGILQIVAIVVAVVATIYTAGAAAGLIGTALATGGTLSAGAATFAAIAGGAIGGAVGSIAAQGVLIAGGAQNGLNWKGVAVGAVGGAVAAGVGGISVGGQTIAEGATTSFGGAVLNGAATAAGTSVANSILGTGAFSWRDIAAGAVSAGVSYGVSTKTQGLGVTSQRVVNGVATGAASAAVHGNLSSSWQGIAQNVVATTIGNSIVDNIARKSITEESRYQFDFSTGGQGVGAAGDALASYRSLDFPMLASSDYESTIAGSRGGSNGLLTRAMSDAELDESQTDIDNLRAQGKDTSSAQQALDELRTRTYSAGDKVTQVDLNSGEGGLQTQVPKGGSFQDAGLPLDLNKIGYLFTHQGELQGQVGEGFASGFVDHLRPMGEGIGTELAQYSLGQFDQTYLSKVATFVSDETFSGWSGARGALSSVTDAAVDFASDPNAWESAWTSAETQLSNTWTSLKEWYASSTPEQVANGVGHVTGDAAAGYGISKVGEFAMAGASFLITRGAAGAGTLPGALELPSQQVGSPYFIRIDPITGRGPMSIDTSSFTSGTTTSGGGVRNAKQFWSSWAKTYPETLSQANLSRITMKSSPLVDDHWIRNFPEHFDFSGETLVHHHLDYGLRAIPVPAPVHAKQPGWGIWHPDHAGK